MVATVFLNVKQLIAREQQEIITVIPVPAYLECDKEVCGWDWGDCGYCASGCKHYSRSKDNAGKQSLRRSLQHCEMPI